MKKVIFGSFLSMSGILSIAILVAGAMTQDWMIDGGYSYLWNLSRYGAIPILVAFVIVLIIGLSFAVKGIIEE